MRFEVRFVYDIERIGESSYTSQSMNESVLIVEAHTSNQAERLVTAMHGGHQNCQVKSVRQLYN